MAQSVPLVKVSELFQVGVVVDNLEESIKRYESMLGIESWKIVTVDSSVVRMTYRGKDSLHSFKAAFTMLGALMIELLEPLEGYGTYREFLDTRGEGVHHLGHVRVDNLDEAVGALEEAGFPCVETGENLGDPAGKYSHKWAYVDTTPALGYIIELSTGMDPRDSFKIL
ncbi:MAG: VOC family protein [Dehalococcoidia bacterium]